MSQEGDKPLWYKPESTEVQALLAMMMVITAELQVSPRYGGWLGLMVFTNSDTVLQLPPGQKAIQRQHSS